jgi:(p)ppGpp synthase/HD superfamily hydrolase
MGNMSTLEIAISIAAQAHAGQLDKAGAPFILHPLRVMLRVDGDEERMAAVLHDVVEDSPCSGLPHTKGRRGVSGLLPTRRSQ